MSLDLKTIAPAVIALFVGAGGASSFFVTRGEADCKASLGAAEVRAELVSEALSSCRSALDLLGVPVVASPPAAIGLGGCVAMAQEPVACPAGCVPALTPEQAAAIEAARAAVQAAQAR